jgi:hypothetical protein
MRKILASFSAVILLTLTLFTLGCNSSSDDKTNQEPIEGTETQVSETEDPITTAPEFTADFTIVLKDVEYTVDDNGQEAIKVNYEFINKGETAIPSEVSEVKATQCGAELVPTTIENSSGYIDYLVRSGGSVQCFAAFQLSGTNEVTVDFINITDSTGKPLLSQTYPAS